MGERRQITAMFCDMVGSTSLSQRLDPEDTQQVVQHFRARCSKAVERYEGLVSRYLGDGVLIHFGFPTAHEDDAERAVRAGLSILRGADDEQLKDGEAVQVRIGIATGLVVVANLEDAAEVPEKSLVGNALNLAARLQGLAEPNGMVISDLTRRLVGNLFEFDDLGVLELKGFNEPQQVWAVRSEARSEGRFRAQRAMAGLPDFVGRSWEFELLRERWSRAQSGAGQVVLVSGEAGIGKSRLLEQLCADIADDDYTRMRYFCLPYHSNTPFYSVIDQMERAAGIERGQGTETKLERLAAALGPRFRDDPTVMTLCAELLSIPTEGSFPALALTAQQRRLRTQEVLVDMVGELAKAKPVLNLFEDAHWIDPSSNELMERAVARAAEMRLLVVMTGRPEYQPDWIDLPHVTSLALNRLDYDHSLRIAEGIAGGKALPEAVATEILKRTDGVPLFVEELTKALMESGLLAEEEKGYRLVGELPALVVPNTLRDSLMARLDRLGPAKSIAQAGAVIGRSFTFGLLAQITEHGEDHLVEALDSLIDAGLMTRRGLPPDATYTFKHALVQDTAYRSLLRGRRAEIHGWIAQVLEEQFPTVREQEPEVLAHHYLESGRTGPALDHLEKAGLRALGRSNYVEGIASLRKALELLAEQPDSLERDERELRLQTALGGALIATRGFAAPETGATYERAAELCRRVGEDTPSLNPVRYGVFVYHLVQSELALARELAEEFERAAQSQTDPTSHLAASRTLGSCLTFMGEWDEALVNLDRALDLYDRGRHGGLAVTYAQDPRIAALALKSWALLHTGRLDEAVELGESAVTEAHAFGHLHTTAYTLGLAGIMLHQFRGDVPRASKGTEILADTCSRQPVPLWSGLALCLQGWAIGMNGDIEGGLVQLRQGYDEFVATGAKLFLPYYNALMAELHSADGDHQAALDRLDEAQRMMAAKPEGWFAAELDRIQGDMLCAVGEVEKAEASYGRGLARARAQGGLLGELRCASGLAELRRGNDAAKAGLTHLRSIFERFDQGLESHDLVRARKLLEG
jgi:class 3 adenylate cyclase/predicted ATPase